MGVGNNAATLALQHEKVRPNLPLLYQQDTTLWSLIKSRTDIEVVSTRPTRIPMELIEGGKFRTANLDGGDLGTGSSITNDFCTLTPAWFLQAWEYTKLSEIATDSSEKAIENYQKTTMKRAMKEFNASMEALMQGDGSNTLTTVTAVGANFISVVNANQLRGNNDYDVWSALGGTFRGTFTASTTDASNKAVYVSGAIPTGTVAGDLILVNGSTGTANSGFYGLRAYQVNSNTGSYMGLSRAAYPGRLSTPYVNGGNQAMTPMAARQFQAKMQTAMGIDNTGTHVVVHLGLDMMAAWENTATNVSSVIYNQVAGDSTMDMLKKNFPKTFAGRPAKVSIHAQPGIIDWLDLDTWFRVEAQPIDYYDAGGQTLFQTYGASGGVSANLLFYLFTGANLGNSNPRAGAYGDSFVMPTGY